MKFTAMTAIVFSLFLLPQTARADVVIDDYSAGTPLTQLGIGSALNTTIDASILGSNRDETVTVTDQGGGEFFGTIGFSGAMDVAQGSLDQINGSVGYSNFSDIDLTQGGFNDVFELRFLSSDINADLAGVVSVTATSDGSSATQFATVPSNAGLPQSVYLNFTDFVGVDFMNIDSISLNFDFANNPGRDVELGLFSATNSIPEPIGTLIIGVCLAGWLQTRRRR
ncbi:MAG: hypothetical protein ACR2NP_20530 [Pirellulaceae bacterium]